MLLIYANRHCSLETVFRMLTFQSIFAIYLFGGGLASHWGKSVLSSSALICPGNESLLHKFSLNKHMTVENVHRNVVSLDRFTSRL